MTDLAKTDLAKTEVPVLVVGGGPAGVAAAVALAEAGLRLLLIEQRDRLGGAIHRQPAVGAPQIWRGPARHRRNWAELASRLEHVAERIELRTSTVFLGIDGAGRFLFDDRMAGRVFARPVRAAIVAVGAWRGSLALKPCHQENQCLFLCSCPIHRYSLCQRPLPRECVELPAWWPANSPFP